MTSLLERWKRTPAPLRVAGWYLVFSLAWIAGTALLEDGEVERFVQTAKGWVFALASALLVAFVGMVEYRRRASSEHRYEQMFRHSPLAVSLATLSEGRFREVNQEFTRVFGYRREELLGSTAPDLGIWVDPDARERAMATLREEKNLRNAESWFRRRDGTTFPGLWSGFVVDVADEPHILALVIDNSEQRQTQERITHLNQELTDRIERLGAMQEISDAIIQTFDLDHTLDVVLEQTAKQLRVDAAHVMLYEPSPNVLVHRSARGMRTDVIRTSRLALGSGRAGIAAQLRRPEMVPDLRAPGAAFVRHDLVEAEQFVSYYAVPLVARDTLHGVLEVFHREPLDMTSSWKADARDLGRQAAIAIADAQLFADVQRANEELRLSYDRTIEGWARALDMRDEETAGHSQRVTDMTVALARRIGVKDDDLADMRRGALLHDIGKMGVPDRILGKPGPLDADEWAIMQRHTILGYDMLSGIPFLERAREIPYAHHERWDGSGYPRGLAGDEIPLGARIFAVVDVFDALTHDRPYRPAWTVEDALHKIRQERGGHFDPACANAFLRMMQESRLDSD